MLQGSCVAKNVLGVTSFPREVRELVERFRRNEDVYRSSQYNETQLRREFIDPFFTALGWDVASYIQAYKDVVLYMVDLQEAHEKAALQCQIAATDAQIDQLVYKLYGLTEQEIQIVEEATEGVR